MTDELDRLRDALAATRPEPDAAARQRALDAAMRAFDKENSASPQGSAAPARPSRHRANWLARLFGGRSMTFAMPSLKPILMGGASLAVITLAVFAYREMPRDVQPLVSLETADPVMRSTTPTVSSGEAPSFSMLSGGGYSPQSEPAPAASPDVSAQLAAPMPEREAREEALSQGIMGSAGSAAQPKYRVRRAGALTHDAMEDVTGEAGFGGSLAKQDAPAAAELGRGAGIAAQGTGVVPVAPGVQPAPVDAAAPHYRDEGRDRFADAAPNPVKITAEAPVSTFSIDVDTASYSFARRAILQGMLPPTDAVRIEEMVNYFAYDYPLPESREVPFRADVQVMPTPWNAQTKLMRIGIQGYALAAAEKPRANLVFLIDTSGSMNAPDKLPLLLQSFRLLLTTLEPDDTVAIVTYAGSAGTVLEPTRVAESGTILAALGRLHAGGSTAGAEGIRRAYALAEQTFDPEGVNRVILATDGDFNVGISSPDELKRYIERKRESGVFLSVLGFGQGNLNDELMQALAQNGNGQAAYIDSLAEAQKALVDEAGSALFPIAKDVKIQVEFNPATVAEYRLIGYETRMLRREDFNNDRIDAGEIGSGHRVTALYEITPPGAAARSVDPLRYQAADATPGQAAEGPQDEYAFLKIRYKAPEGEVSRLIETPITRAMEVDPGDARSGETRFAAAVAGFGQLLKGGHYTGAFSYDDVIALASGARGEDRFGYRADFAQLVRLAKTTAALQRQ